jgi:hypothetical protein
LSTAAEWSKEKRMRSTLRDGIAAHGWHALVARCLLAAVVAASLGACADGDATHAADTTDASAPAAPAATEIQTTSAPNRPAPTSTSWDVKYAPPSMPSARVIEIPRDLQKVSWPAYSVFCAGSIYQIKLGANEDAIIRFSGTSPLRYPLWIDGGRNVRVIGMQMDLEVQPGCGAGELQNIGGAASVHPRIPGGIALRLEQWATTFIEGAYIDMRNMESDCIVVRNPDSMSGATARGQRDLIVQNSACHGIGGLGQSDIGDGEHGDLVQNQGDDVLRRLILENVTARSSSQGVMLHPNQGFRGATEFVLRRFDYAFDPRYTGKTKYDGPWGLGINASADIFNFEEVWIKDYAGRDYGIVDDQRYGVYDSSNVKPLAGMKSGYAPNGPFAPASRIGVNYVSPHR